MYVFRVSLLALIAVSIFSTSVFAESTIQVSVSEENIKSLDSIWITGKITDVSQWKSVRITVTDPDGIVVYRPSVAISDDGTFRDLMHPTLPSFKTGTYTVIASQEETQVTAKTQFTVTSEAMPRNQITQPSPEPAVSTPQATGSSKITLTADTVNGSNIIKINGYTEIRSTDITFIVNAPSGNIISIGQVSPDAQGKFQLEIKTGGPIWKENGMYSITANQGSSSEYKKSIQVEIKDGVVVPEFGTIASLVLLVSVIAIIMVSSKSKISIIPRF